MINREMVIQLRKFIEQMSENATDEEALDNILAFPRWEVGKAYETGERIRYENVLYKVLQNHTSQADWTPDIAVSLYVRVSIDEFPEWVQPTGAHDSYMKNDRVSHLDRHWTSDIDYNTYEPGVYGWNEE